MGALDDEALAAFFERVGRDGGERDLTSGLNQMLESFGESLLDRGLSSRQIKARMRTVLDRVEKVAEAERIALEGERAALLATIPDLSDWQGVTLKSYSRLRGCGYLTAGEGTHDIFVRRSIFERCGIEGLRPKERLDVRTCQLGNGLEAVEVAYPVGFVE